jgi:hypothetical protein
MKAIFNEQTLKFKTYEGWTELTRSKKGTVINGLEDVMLFTHNEATLNVLKKPLAWRHVNPRVNWRMFK